MHLLWNAPIEALSRTFAFGQLESGDKAIAPDVGSERAEDGNGNRNGNGNGNQYGDDGDGDDTTSGSSVDSNRVNAALLAEESQHMRQTRGTGDEDLPVSSRPPIRLTERPYGLVRRSCQRGRIKIEAIKVSQTQERETTHLGRACATQTCRNPSKGCLKGHRPRRQCGRMKIAPVMVKIERLNDKTAREDGKTHLEHIRTAQPPANDFKCLYGVVGPRRRCGRIKIAPTNVS